MEKIIIIGAGPAGMAAALKIKNDDNEVIILERNNNVGKKLLITGAGKCNYLNEDFNISHYRSNNLEMISSIINDKSKDKIKQFITSIGIEPKIKNGYYYPNSQTSVSVQNALLLEMKRKKIKIYYNEKVEKVINSNGFLITTENNTHKADKLIIATGSKSTPKTGSDGSGYNFLIDLGLEVIKPLPALTQLKTSGKYLKDWAGIRTDALVSLIEDGTVLKKEIGEIQLTDYGVSGICIMQLSGTAIKGLQAKKQEKLQINFLPQIDNFKDYITKRNELLKERTIIELLEGIINYKLLYALLKTTSINPNQTYEQIKNKKELENVLTRFEIEINGYNDFDKAQVCQGGLKLTELKNNFETKIDGLFVIGELLDVDGDCGGYNIAFAILSGIIVGEGINDKNKTN